MAPMTLLLPRTGRTSGTFDVGAVRWRASKRSLSFLAVFFVLGLLIPAASLAAPKADPLVVQRYDATLETKTGFVSKHTGGNDAQGPQAAATMSFLQLKLAGTVETVVLEDELDGALAWVRLVDARFDGLMDDKKISSTDLAPTVLQLSEGIYIKIPPDGLVRDVRDSHLTDRFASQMLKFLAYGMQLKKPDGKAVQAWQVEETDATGRYEAAYKITGRDDQSLSIVKHKTGYKSIDITQVGGQPGGTPEGSVKGKLTARVDAADFGLVSLESEESSAIFLFDKKSPQSTSETSFKLTRVAAQRLSSQEHEAARRLASTGAKPSETRARAAAISTAKATLKNATPLDLKRLGEEADATKKRGTNVDVDVDVFLKARAFFILYPERVLEIERLYADLSDANSFYRASLLALSVLPDSTYVAALHRAIEAAVNGRAWSSALYAIPLLSRHALPPKESEDLLVKIASSQAPKEVRDSAHLALGAVAANVASSDPGRARRIVDRYASMMKNEDDLLLGIEVLGNTGSDGLVRILDEPMKNPSELVRSTAVYSLRRATSSKATDMVIAVASSDKSASVRKAACDALVFHADLTRHISTLAQLLRKDDSVDVRHGLIRILSRYYLDSAEARSAIDAAALGDQDASVRHYAKSITGGKEAAPSLIP